MRTYNGSLSRRRGARWQLHWTGAQVDAAFNLSRAADMEGLIARGLWYGYSDCVMCQQERSCESEDGREGKFHGDWCNVSGMSMSPLTLYSSYTFRVLDQY